MKAEKERAFARQQISTKNEEKRAKAKKHVELDNKEINEQSYDAYG